MFNKKFEALDESIKKYEAKFTHERFDSVLKEIGTKEPDPAKIPDKEAEAKFNIAMKRDNEQLSLKQAKFLPPNGIRRVIYQGVFFGGVSAASTPVFPGNSGVGQHKIPGKIAPGNITDPPPIFPALPLLRQVSSFLVLVFAWLTLFSAGLLLGPRRIGASGLRLQREIPQQRNTSSKRKKIGW